jgi:hypothetical protein
MNQAHADMDETGDWAESHPITRRAHRALPLPADKQWTPRRVFVPQGADQQGRQVPTIPVVIDRLPEDYDQTDSADGEVLAWLLKGLAVVMLACFSAWCIASYLELARV